MLACTCIDVDAPSWLPPIEMSITVLLALGWIVFALAFTGDSARRRHQGLVLVGIGVAVFLPLSAAAMGVRTTLDGMDQPHHVTGDMRVDCNGALQGPASEHVPAALVAACSEATQGWRWTGYGLGAVGTTLVVAGAAIAPTRRPRVRRTVPVPAAA